MIIKSERKRVGKIDYSHEYVYKNDRYSGFTFPCNRHGDLLNLTPEAIANYERVTNDDRLKYLGIIQNDHSWVEPAIGICDSCGSDVVLISQYCGATSCDKCGAWYNLSGQRLNPPEQWQEPIDPEDYY